MGTIAVFGDKAGGAPVRTTYRHGHVPEAMCRAARSLLESGDPEDVGLREIARRIGVSATAAYRHFTSKDELMATVAAQGFRELAEALRPGVKAADPAVAIGLAYVDFALTQRGLFRLMFGPLLARRKEFRALDAAAAEAFGVIERAGVVGKEPEKHEDAASMAAWGLIHGLSTLFVENVLPEQDARRLAQDVLESAGRTRAHGAQPSV